MQKRSIKTGIVTGIFVTGFLSGCAQDVSKTGYWTNELSQSNTVVCDPFGGGAGPSSNNGLDALLTYIPATSSVVANLPAMTTQTFAPGQPDVQVASARVILNKIAVSTRDFTEGFSETGGTKLKNSAGEDLIEWFSLRVRGKVMANTNTEAGLYQFAVMSDDGSVMEIDPTGTGNNFQSIVSNDGHRNNTMGCSSVAIPLVKDQGLPIKVNYFQGPRVRISFSLFWRKVANNNAASLADPECGTLRADNYFFVNGTPTAKYNQMLARGWQVIPSANLYLSDGSQTNPCAN